MDRVLRTLEVCTVFIAIGTSGVVEPAASFVGQTKARTFYVGPEEPINLASFDETLAGKAGELLPTMFDVGDLRRVQEHRHTHTPEHQEMMEDTL